MLKKGDKVVMHTCIEAEKYNGKIWTCEGDEFKANTSGNGVFLEGFGGWFYTEYLQRINIEGIKLVNIDLTGITTMQQLGKVTEEEKEFMVAIELADRENAIEEFWDTVQVKLGLMDKIFGIKADEIMKGYPLHLEKIKDRPRDK